MPGVQHGDILARFCPQADYLACDEPLGFRKFARDGAGTRRCTPPAHPVNDRSERQFLFAKDLAVSDMAQASLAQPSGDVDRDFAGMMMARDQAATELARAELQYGHNDELKRLAQDIIAQQQQDSAVMQRAIGDVPTR